MDLEQDLDIGYEIQNNTEQSYNQIQSDELQINLMQYEIEQSDQEEQNEDRNSLTNSYGNQYKINNQSIQHLFETTEELSEQTLKEGVQKEWIDELFNNHKIEYYSKDKQQIIDELLKKNYALERYVDYNGIADCFEGYLQSDQTTKLQFLFNIQRDQSREEYENEIEIWKNFEQPINVLKLIDTFQINEYYILVLEKYQYTLKQELILFSERKIMFSLNKLFQIIFDLLLGLIQFRIYNIIHLDIKPGNIVLSKEGNYYYANFYSSFDLKKNQEIEINFLTKFFASPEVLDHLKNIDYSSDVYSLGVTLKKVLDVFKNVHQDYLINKENIRKIINNFEQIIEQNMILTNRTQRQKCHNLLELFLQQLQEQQLFEMLLNQQNNINQMICLDRYDEKIDLPYFLQVKLLLSSINLHFFQNKQNLLDDNINNCIQNKLHFPKGNYNRQGLTIQKRCNPDLIKSLNDIGQCYIDLGKEKKCLKYLLELLEIQKQEFQQNHPYTATSLNDIGLCYMSIGEYNTGLNYLLESLEMRKQMFQIQNHPDIATSLNNIGLCQMKLYDYNTGLKYLLESLDMRKQIFGGNHTAVAESLNNVGLCYQILGQKYYLESQQTIKQISQEKLNQKSNQ